MLILLFLFLFLLLTDLLLLLFLFYLLYYLYSLNHDIIISIIYTNNIINVCYILFILLHYI
jgi:hypothetical protein